MAGVAAERLESAGSIAARPVEGVGASTIEPFDTFYPTYRLLLRKIAIRKFQIPTADVDDLVQDVFATYIANKANVHDRHAYLIGAICNAARQY